VRTFPYPPGPRGGVPPEYAELQATQPVARVPLADGTQIWLVTRYDDVLRVLTDPVFSRHRAALLPGTGFGRSQGSGIVDLDPPEHDRLRAPVVAAFDVARVHRWRARIEAIAQEVLVALAAGPGPGTADLVSGYTAPLAGRTTCEMLGVTGEGWRQLTADVELQLSAARHSPQEVAQAQQRIRETLTGLLRSRCDHPGDDVASTLLGAGGELGDSDRLVLLQGLVVSGLIGVRDLLARHLFAVLADPQLLSRLCLDPAAVPSAVEELLRCYPSSNDGLLRMATEDVDLGGARLRAGDAALPLVSAACRDPRRFPEPDRIDVDRAADRDLAFGAGRHACPAADLARSVLGIGIAALLARFPDIGLAVPADEVEHTSDLLPLGIQRLPVRLGQAVTVGQSPTSPHGEGAP